MKIKRPIIALDFNDRQVIESFLDKFPKDEALFVKIGMESYYSNGQDLIRAVKARGHDVFLDLKCHDIPHTVERALFVLGSLGVDLTTIHASGGSQMMQAAKNGLLEGAAKSGQKAPKLLAITQLTSSDERVVKDEQLCRVSLEESVKHYAKLAAKAGCDGVVCSGFEAQMIKEVTTADFLRVTPGIRGKEDSVDDQKRVMTPQAVAKNGASAIVVGRSITQAKDPYRAYQQIKALWNE